MTDKKQKGIVELIPKQTWSKGYYDIHIPENIINRVFKTKGSSIKKLASTIPVFNKHLQSILAGPNKTEVGKRSKWLINSSVDLDDDFDTIWNNIKGPILTSNRTPTIHLDFAIVMHDLQLLDLKVCPDNIFMYHDFLNCEFTKEELIEYAIPDCGGANEI